MKHTAIAGNLKSRKSCQTWLLLLSDQSLSHYSLWLSFQYLSQRASSLVCHYSQNYACPTFIFCSSSLLFLISSPKPILWIITPKFLHSSLPWKYISHSHLHQTWIAYPHSLEWWHKENLLRTYLTYSFLFTMANYIANIFHRINQQMTW